MAYQLQFTRAAERDLRGLPRQVLKRVDRALRRLAEEPRPNGCQKLRGSQDIYRVRVGDYRLLYEVEDQALLVLLIRIGHRKEVYER